MAKAKKRSRRSGGTRKTARRTKGKAKRRVSFPKLWKRLGNAVLRSLDKDRKALVAQLAADRELQRILVERTVRLLSARASEMQSAVRPSNPVPVRREEATPEEFALAARSADLCCEESKSCDSTPGEEKADWRLF